MFAQHDIVLSYVPVLAGYPASPSLPPSVSPSLPEEVLYLIKVDTEPKVVTEILCLGGGGVRVGIMVRVRLGVKVGVGVN